MVTTKQRISSWIGVFAVVGVVLAPVAASAATDSDTTTVNANVGSSITITTDGTVDIDVTPTASGSASSASDTVLVSTNNAIGYNLQLANGDTNTDLVNGTDTIAAGAGTQGTPLTLANNSWGYRVDGAGGFGAGATSAETDEADLTGTWAGVPASGSENTLKSTGSPATNDSTTVWYGVKADTSNPNGTYTDTVTYTATTN